MQTILSKMHLGTPSPDQPDSGTFQPLSTSMFFCSSVGATMSRLACEARKARCDEADAERIRNPVSECRECEGWASMKKKLVTKDHKPRQQAPEVAGYHMGEKTKHQKFPCQCCGAKVWLSGSYCMSCHGQFEIAAEHGIGREQAIEAVRKFYAEGGVRPHRGGKNNSARTLIDWKGEKDVPQTAKEKKGTCAWCERPDKAFVRKFDGRSACGACSSALYKALAVGIPNEKLWEVCRPEIKEKNSRIVKGTSKPQVWYFLKKYTVASQEIPEPPHEKSTDIPTNHIADSGMADPVADSGKSIEEHQNLKYPVPQGGIVNSLQCLAPQAIIIDLDQEPEIKTLLEKLGKQQRRSSLSDVVLAILDGMVVDASAREAAEGDS